MPMNFPFRRRVNNKRPDPKEQLQVELNEAIEKLARFSEALKHELAVSDAEENRINPPSSKTNEPE